MNWLRVSQKANTPLSSVFDTETFAQSTLCTSGYLYLIGTDIYTPINITNRLFIFTESGDPICSLDLPDSAHHMVLGNDGQVYVREETATGNDIFSIDLSAKSLEYQFSSSKGEIYDGDENFFLLLDTDDGLYGLNSDGTSMPIVIWSECDISLSERKDVVSLSNGLYFCLLRFGLSYVLAPADPAEAKTKTRLALASVGEIEDVQACVMKFNSFSQDYFIEIVDYTNDGTFSDEQAIIKLNTEIVSGNTPDMICFSNLSPFAYISRGYLIDMQKFFST